MNYTAIFFDLDGNLTDSSEGITKCAALALSHFGLPVPDTDALKVFIGPPLRETFPRFGVPEERVEEAVSVFRSRYTTVGKFENRPYDGIRQVLETLTELGIKLYVATSKPQETAVEILDKFDLSRYFRLICGATMDGRRDSKESVIAYLLEQTGTGEKAVMVGDTAYDVIGANAFSIPTIGVSWGYGEVADMEKAGAVSIAHTPDELVDLLNR